MTNPFVTAVFEWMPVRAVVAAGYLLRGLMAFALGQLYQGLSDYCWVYRVSRIRLFRAIVYPRIRHIAARAQASDAGFLRKAFLRHKAADRTFHRYTLGSGTQDPFRDMIVLKSPTMPEKGLILVTYGETYDALMRFFDIKAIMERYYIALEMSWSGACDPSFLMFIDKQNPIVVQTPEKTDQDFLNNLGTSLHKINMGSGDWTDTTGFVVPQDTSKEFDIVMVANWGRHKNHRMLFAALGKIASRPIRVLCIGFPLSGRTTAHIQREFQRHCGHRPQITLTTRERIPHNDVKELVAKSRMSVLLSRKEGANKAVMESLFLDVPAIVYDRHLGGSREQINEHTGMLSSFEDLHRTIVHMLDHLSEFHPRRYVLEHSGSVVSTRRLNELLRQISAAEGRPWTVDISEKINNPNLTHKNPHDMERFAADYQFLRSSVIAEPTADRATLRD